MLDLPSHFLKGFSVVMWFLSDIRAYKLLGLSDVRTDKPLVYLPFPRPPPPPCKKKKKNECGILTKRRVTMRNGSHYFLISFIWWMSYKMNAMSEHQGIWLSQYEKTFSDNCIHAPISLPTEPIQFSSNGRSTDSHVAPLTFLQTICSIVHGILPSCVLPMKFI